MTLLNRLQTRVALVMKRRRRRMARKKNKQTSAPVPPDISAATVRAASITHTDVLECKSSASPAAGHPLVECKDRISEWVPESVLQDANLNADLAPREPFCLVWQEINPDSEDANALFSSLDSSKENINVRTDIESSSNALMELERKKEPQVAACKTSRKSKQNAQRKQPRRSCKHTANSQTLPQVETFFLVGKQRTPGLVMLAPNCIGRTCVVAMNRFDCKITLSGCVSLNVVRHEDLHVPSETWRVQLRPGTVVSVISHVVLLNTHKQLSEETNAERNQEDNLTELLEERRAYMSQLRLAFYGSDEDCAG